MPEINFDFETLSPTQIPPNSPAGALSDLSITQSGLTIDISREQSSFDIVSNVGDQQKSIEFGQRSLTPFSDETDPTLFTVNFSANVYRVSVTMGDYGEDEDVLFVQAYSGLNATGDFLDVDAIILPESDTDNFSSQVLILESTTPIRSIEMIGGSEDFPNSVFYDNLTVDTAAPFSNDTIATAQNIGVLSSDLAIQGSVSSVDENDYFQFSLPSDSDLSLSLTDLIADADIELFDGNGALIDGSYNTSNASEALTLSNLAAGIYYARVNYYRGSQPSGDTPYTLSLSSDRIDGAGNSLSAARDIGTLSYVPIRYRDWVGDTDSSDYYQFSVSETSDVNLILDNLNADADLYLVQDINQNGTVDLDEQLESSILSGTTPDAINIEQLAAGTYFVEVRAFDESSYSLSLAATPSDLAGNTPATALSIATPGVTPVSFNDFIGDIDTDDYYRFSLDRASNLSLQVTNLLSTGEIAADVDLELLRINADGTVSSLALSDNSGITLESIALTNLGTGTYLARIYQYSGNTTYTFNLAATPFTPVDNAGNTLRSARDVGILRTSEQFYSDWVGTSDENDFYRFSLASTSNLSVVLDGLTEDADLYLIQDFNDNGIVDADDVLLSSFKGGSSAEAISVDDLAAGSYFIDVENYDASNTFYNLSMSATAVNSTDWFDQNLRDPELVSLARSLATNDDQLSRNEMISLFRNAQDNNLISVTEQTDLRTIVANFARFNMLDYVRFLSSETANNIAANMTAAESETLIGRYFLGTETPGDRYTNRKRQETKILNHVEVQGILYDPLVERANIADIVQGRIANCYLVAALGAVALSQPDLISDMVIDNGDTTYTIRFYQRSGSRFVAQYVTIDQRLAVEQGSTELFFANAGSLEPDSRDNRDNINDPDNILWSPLIERAYAQWYEFYKNDSSSDSGYTAIGNGGGTDRAISEIIGRSCRSLSTRSISFTDIQSVLADGQPIAASSPEKGETDLIVGWHAYTLVDAFVDDMGEQRIILYNPWGKDGKKIIDENDGFIELSFAEFQSSLDRIYHGLPT